MGRDASRRPTHTRLHPGQHAPLHTGFTSMSRPPINHIHTQLEKRIDHNVAVAKELIAQQKRDRALLALKKKKLAENQLTNLHNWLLQVEGVVRGRAWWQRAHRGGGGGGRC